MRALIAVVLVAALAGPAAAYVPEKTPARNAEASARTMLAQPKARDGLPGIVVMRGGRELFSLNGAKGFAPASVMKLATTTTALIRFGPDHRFSTHVLALQRGPAVSGLYLVGGGDPTLSTEAYRRNRFLPKPTDVIRRPAFAGGSPTIEQLADRVVAAGVRRVQGPVIADESLFDTRRTQEGWLQRYLVDEPDVGFLSALTINEGYADLKQLHLLPSPAMAAAQAFASALAARGVVIAGRVHLGRAPTRSVEIARVESPPLAQIVDFTNRYSINYDAELLLKGLGAAFARSGTTAGGVTIVRATLRDLGIPLAGFQMFDGSGLSILDRITPRALATLLNRILTTPGKAWDALRTSIPVAGEPGTLQKRLMRPPTAGNLRGKTGQIPRVRAMAGWVTASDGVPLVYVAVFNDVPHPVALTGPLDLFGLLLAFFPGF